MNLELLIVKLVETCSRIKSTLADKRAVKFQVNWTKAIELGKVGIGDLILRAFAIKFKQVWALFNEI